MLVFLYPISPNPPSSRYIRSVSNGRQHGCLRKQNNASIDHHGTYTASVYACTKTGSDGATKVKASSVHPSLLRYASWSFYSHTSPHCDDTCFAGHIPDSLVRGQSRPIVSRITFTGNVGHVDMSFFSRRQNWMRRQVLQHLLLLRALT